jgi:acetyl-CoA carboxylase biotin carboxyl carrier protein
VTLTAADVAAIMRLVEQSGFDHLSLEMDGIKLSLSRGGVPTSAVEVPTADSSSSGAQSIAASAAPLATPGRVTPRMTGPGMAAPGMTGPGMAGPGMAGPGMTSSADSNVSDITAPMLGTFYRAPKPGAPPFVEVGAVVAEDTVIAIIEVMKLMNTVRAGVNGVITEILAGDETLVEFGAVLMRARREV